MRYPKSRLQSSSRQDEPARYRGTDSDWPHEPLLTGVSEVSIFGISNSEMSGKMEYQTRFFYPPEQSFFLFGPRGTGKSSWIEHTYSKALVVDLLKPDVFREMSARP